MRKAILIVTMLLAAATLAMQFVPSYCAPAADNRLVCAR